MKRSERSHYRVKARVSEGLVPIRAGGGTHGQDIVVHRWVVTLTSRLRDCRFEVVTSVRAVEVRMLVHE